MDVSSVHLRKRKQGKSGRISLYLEFYKGAVTQPDGKAKVLRDYEYLNLYLDDKPRTAAEKEHNKNILELAKSIKAKRELEIKNGQYGFDSCVKAKALFLSYFKAEAEKKSKPGYPGNWGSTLKHLTRFVEKHRSVRVTFREIDKAFCEGFKDYLRDEATTRTGKGLSSASQGAYYGKFKACLNKAIKDGILSVDPAKGVARPKIVSHKREYLTFDELQAMAKAECRNPTLKRMFLFSCLTGLRFSDCHKLIWGEVEQYGDGWRIVFHQQKTKGLQYHDISQQARELMGEQGAADDRVFFAISKYSAYLSIVLREWVLKAGITKHLTFHSGRHTFAVLQLENGTDIYTLSKLLGHREIEVTAIYADILDKKRREAMTERIPELSL
ncbi:MAG: site-specific integrase [Chlorobium phaeobacteroides]|uniref:Integrase family protein n=1 Tax=Chlorobium phaeobacteroides (strain BS1) TaxID=331678 RepID=B3EKK6_CHLPB|nr:site-specific integrase [Chlorobium phaeobacteroides]